MISIYQFGTFDVANYGDLLFPLLARHRLASLGVNIVAISPIGDKPVWKDCMPSAGINTIDYINSPDGVLIGGGNIITLSPTHLAAYNQCPTALLAYPDIWIGACRLVMNNVPVLWNAPGVPKQFSPDERPFVKECLERSLYISVRDEQSRYFLLECCPDKEIFVFPDTAWVTTELWDSEELYESYENIFNERKQKIPQRSVVVHLNSRYLAGATNQDIAHMIDETANELDAKIILVAMGPCHGDDELAREVGRSMNSDPIIIDKPHSLKEITSCLASAVAYIGSSMHGLIISASFSVPGICVTDGKKTKIKGLKQQLNIEDSWAQNWQTAIEQLLSMDMYKKRIQLTKIKRKMLERVDEHWTNISNLITKHINKNKNIPEKDIEACHKQSKIFWSGRTELAAFEALKSFGFDNRIGEEYSNTYSLIAKKERELAETRNEISKRDKVIANYRNELYSVYTSRSWRYTAPFRGIKSLIRRVLKIGYWPPILAIIMRAYFLLPRRIRSSTTIENLKNRFRSSQY